MSESLFICVDLGVQFILECNICIYLHILNNKVYKDILKQKEQKVKDKEPIQWKKMHEKYI